MECLNALSVRNLRILRSLDIPTTADFNLITGDNGSGKTTTLEAIYLIGHGRSFRTHQARQFIRRDSQEASIRAVIGENTIVLRRNANKLVINRNGAAVSRRQLVGLIPVRKFIPQDHRFIEGSSVLRRQFLDWGLYHLQAQYPDLWVRFVRVLRQRNAELKKKGGNLSYWSDLFCKTSQQLHEFRLHYWQQINERVHQRIEQILALPDCRCEYFQGWAHNRQLHEDVLKNQYRDTLRGYTSVGPHRADLLLTVAGKPASQQLSRGQQKMWNLAMNMAQVEHLHELTGRRCLWLVDDLASELDHSSFDKVVSMFRAKHAQFWFTAFSEQQARFNKALADSASITTTDLARVGFV